MGTSVNSKGMMTSERKWNGVGTEMEKDRKKRKGIWRNLKEGMREDGIIRSLH